VGVYIEKGARSFVGIKERNKEIECTRQLLHGSVAAKLQNCLDGSVAEKCRNHLDGSIANSFFLLLFEYLSCFSGSQHSI